LMKPCKGHRRWLWLATLWLALPVLGAHAQMQIGASTNYTTVNDFKVPDYDENGKKKSVLYGDMAEMLPDNKVRITKLRIEIFKDGVIEGTIHALTCVFDRKERNAISNADVSIEKGNMRVTGKGFRYYAADQHIEILNNVCVTLQDTKMWAKRGKP